MHLNSHKAKDNFYQPEILEFFSTSAKSRLANFLEHTPGYLKPFEFSCAHEAVLSF
jgi:hypothetical protein